MTSDRATLDAVIDGQEYELKYNIENHFPHSAKFNRTVLDALHAYKTGQDSKDIIAQLRERVVELEDLLTSAKSIVDRYGEGTAWERFSNRLAQAGIGSVTPRTFRVLPGDE